MRTVGWNGVGAITPRINEVRSACYAGSRLAIRRPAFEESVSLTMAVICGHCGEELLGAVNRCWRCGHSFSAIPDQGGLPPVRRPPQKEDGDGPVAATLTEGEVTPTPRRSPDSPFMSPLKRTLRSSRNAIHECSSPSAVILGGFALLTSIWTLWSSVPAILGFLLGLLGLRSPRPLTAVLGLLLCCLALSGGLIRSIVLYDAYQQDRLQRGLSVEEFR